MAGLVQLERETAADLSHRLRTPLTGAKLNADSLPEGERKERLVEQLDEIERVVDHVIDEIRRPDRQARSPATDVAAVVADRVEFWEPLAADEGRRLEAYLRGQRPRVALPEADLAAALDALIGNVFAHTDAGSDLRIGVRSTGDGYVDVHVEDAGEGFPADMSVEAPGEQWCGLDRARSRHRQTHRDRRRRRSPAGKRRYRWRQGHHAPTDHRPRSTIAGNLFAPMSLLRNPPETHYADSGDGYIAYQTFGEGPDVLFLNDAHSNVEVMWEQPLIAEYFDRLSSFARVTYFDNRGVGASDAVPQSNMVLDYWVDDARFVMDAAGIERATLIGDVEGGPGAMMFVATYPDRASGLVLTNSYARWLRADDFPIGMPQDRLSKLIELVRLGWGKPGFFSLPAPSTVGDPQLEEWLARYQRLAAPPSWALMVSRWYGEVDIRSILPNISAPTLIITREDAVYHRPSHGRYLAEHIPNARLVELPGADTTPFWIDGGPVLDEIEEFLTGERPRPVIDRTLATVLFTDIVDSTGHLARLGDQQWLSVLGRHDQLTRDYLHRYRGTERDTSGDGFLATFDGPTRAVTCAAELQRAMPDLGIQVRAGLHTGEVELAGGDVGGLAVHIAARVIDAEPGSGVMVSSTVKDLVAGSGIEFEPRGSHELKGVPGEWQLYSVAGLP